MNSNVVSFTSASNSSNQYSFAHYDFSTLTENASKVVVNFKYYNTSGGRGNLTIGDASLRGTTGGCSTKVYYNKVGGIIRFASDKNNFYVNDTKLALATYCSQWLNINVEVDVVNKTVSYVIKDASGSELKSESNLSYYSSDATECSQIDVSGGAVTNSKMVKLDDISITSTVDASSIKSYTINYKYNNEIIKTVTETANIGTVINAESPLTVGDVKYLTADDATTSLTIASDEASNVLDVDMRLPYTATLKVSTTVGDATTEANTDLTETDGKVCSWTYSYPLYKVVDGKYYKLQGDYTKFTETGTFSDKDEISRSYTYTLDEDVTYFDEWENSTYTQVKSDNSVETFSGGIGRALMTSKDATMTLTLSNITAGNYRIYIPYKNTSDKSRTHNISINETSYDDVTVTAGNTGVFDEIVALVDGDNTVTVNLKANNYLTSVFDYLLVKPYVTEDVTVTDAKFATYCSANALDFTNSTIKAYTATVSNGVATLTQIEQVPANTGVMLYSAAGEATEAIPVIGSATAPTSNAFIGVTEKTTVYGTDGSKTNYVLGSKDGAVSFYKAASTGTVVGANKAYLSTESSNTSTDAKQITIVFDGETTGINNVKAASTKTNTVYNLNGQRVAQPQKGLYIVNGKKVILK